MEIMLDPGHGPAAPGANYNGHDEQALNFGLADEILALTNRSRHIHTTRPNFWNTPSLPDRARMANKLDVDLFISLHFDAYKAPSAYGAGVYYYGHPDLADAMADRIKITTGMPCRVRKENFYVIKHTRMPALLVEGGFLTNPDDALALQTPEYPHKLAVSIWRGIAECLKIQGVLPRC